MSRGRTLLVLVALVAGLILGALAAATAWHDAAVATAATVGGLWLDALKMTVIPLIVALLVNGIVGGADAARAGGVASRTIIWIVLLYSLSAIFGGIAMPALLAAFPLPASATAALQAGLQSVDVQAVHRSVASFRDFVGAIIPSNIIKAAADGEILQLVVFTVAFAIAIDRIAPPLRATLVNFFDALGAAMLVIIGWVLWIAPLGVFALGFALGAGAGGTALGAVLHYLLVYTSLSIVIIVAGYVLAVVAARYRLGQFARAVAPAQAVAFSTQSSVASLPAMLVSAKELGVPAGNADVSLPLAAALFRVTGPAMNLGVCIYIAHWLGMHLTVTQMIAGIAVASVASYSAPGLPGQISFVTSIAPIAIAMGIPVEPLGILIALEPIPDIFRTVGNVTVDVAMTGAIARKAPAELNAG